VKAEEKKEKQQAPRASDAPNMKYTDFKNEGVKPKTA